MYMDADLEAKLPDIVRKNKLAIGLIGAAILVSVLLVLAGAGGDPAPSVPDTDTNDTDDGPGTNFSQNAGANETRVGGDVSEANRTYVMNITSSGIDPSSVEIAVGDAVRLNNLNDYAVVVDWEDANSGANVTIEARSSFATRVRGTEYFLVYPQDPDARRVMYGGPIQVADG